MSKEKFSFYKEHPKTCNEKDFWGQVKRTVNGKPVSQEQIDLIVNAVTQGLNLKKDDCLLDLCCGNGALSHLLFERCAGGLGVDFSEYLISVAKRFFSSQYQSYLLQDVVAFCESPLTPQSFTKMLCYGSFSYIEKDRAQHMLHLLHEGFPNLERVFIGNYPDKDKMGVFYGDREIEGGVESNPDSSIGIWRTENEFIQMAEASGWQIKIHRMPQQYYASHYRYDVILFR